MLKNSVYIRIDKNYLQEVFIIPIFASEKQKKVINLKKKGNILWQQNFINAHIVAT